MRFLKVVPAIALLALSAHVALAQPAAERFNAVRHDPQRLRRFLEAMPKGGDLHNHLTGSVFAESYLQWAADDKLCLDTKQLAIVPTCAGDSLVPAANALTSSTLYQQMLDAMSMRQFRSVTESGHDHFFGTFSKFGAVSRTHAPAMTAEVIHRFAVENVDYVEMIFSPDRGAAARIGNDLPSGADFATMRDQLLASAAFRSMLDGARKSIDEATGGVRDHLHCGKPDAMAGCDTDLRFVYEAHRGFPRGQLFAELVAGFELASSDRRMVGLNPVMPEDGYVSMTTFTDLMAMFAFLRPLYPKVRLSTHAGELAPGLVPPEGLRFHIRDSVEIAKADRIGHGVDVARETNEPQLLREMAERHVAVEVCLTSNDVILGVTGKHHPLPLYLAAGVPVALASDDPGVSRIDLTNEFQRAVEEFGLGYDDLVRFARNSIEYSFLEGSSLFLDHDYAHVAEECRAASSRCDAFLTANAKARVQWKLERRLLAFDGGDR
jgi:adenosine deaminase